MRKILGIGLLVLIPTMIFAQKTRLEGVVQQADGTPMEMANVIAFVKGTKTLMSYSITDSKGNFRLSLDRGQTYTLKTSYIGYDTREVEVTVDESGQPMTRNITLNEASEKLSEVEITYEMPVKIVGDTIVYNADSFVSGKEKKLEDVLEKLPGVDIDDNGEVEVEGKKVDKVLVEGKEFFDGDSKLATQNIPANAVDKVEVLRNYNEVEGMRSVTNNEDNIALNIRLKTGKERFWFGELNAGAGEDDKYIVKPKIFYYSPEKSINLLADFNNIGEAPFTISDYFRFSGGLRGAMRGSGTSFNIGSGGLGFTMAQNNRSLESISRFGAVNFNLSPKKGLDFNGFALGNNAETTMLTQFNTVFNKTGLTESNRTAAEQGSELGMFKFSTTYRPNADVHIDYDIFGKTSTQTEMNDVTSSNRGAVDTYKEEKPFSLNQNFNVYYTIDEKNIFAAELQHLYEKDEPLYNSLAETQPFAIIPASDTESLYDLLQDKKTTTSKFDGRFDYYYLLTPKSHFNLTLGTTFSAQSLNSGITQRLDSGNLVDFSDPVLNNDADYNFTDVFLGLKYKMVTGIFTFHPGIKIHHYRTRDEQFGTEQIDKLTRVVPDLYANLQFKSSQSLRFTYDITNQFTDINNIAEGYLLSSYNALRRGSRDLEHALNHRYSLNFFSFSMFSFTNINASVTYTKRVNGVKNQTELVGVDRISFPINSNFADETFSAFFRYGKTYTKFKTHFRTRMNSSIFNNVVNGEAIRSKNFSHSYQGSIATNFKNAPNLEVGYEKSFSDYSNTGSSTDRPFANVEIGFLKNFILTADYSYYNYENDEKTVTNTYSFLSANLYYQAEDSKWEFKLSGTNLTDNTSMNRDSYNEIADSNSTSLYFIQPRLLMFSVKYNL
jgi:hypothetical protein